MTLIRRQQAAGRPVTPFRASRIARPASRNEIHPQSETAGEGSLSEPDGTISHLEIRIDELEEALELERKERVEACETAFAEGNEEGRTVAATEEAKRSEMLRQAIEQALAGCVAKIEERTDLAVSIARTALQKILGPGSDREGMAEAIIRHDAVQLSTRAILRVRVSPGDFPEETTLLGLSAARGGVEIIRDPDLETGSCLFDLTLGTIDASLPVQAQKLDQLLARAERASA